MIIGVPREIKKNENRVALTPSGAEVLKQNGHQVLVETNAGAGSGFSNQEYMEAGAEMIATAKEVFDRADMILKVKEPIAQEYPLIRKGQVLFTDSSESRPLTAASCTDVRSCRAYGSARRCKVS
jgi:alanine dehydrogenase